MVCDEINNIYLRPWIDGARTSKCLVCGGEHVHAIKMPWLACLPVLYKSQCGIHRWWK